MSRYVFLTLGVVSLGLAFAGVVLPLVPTTPFALFAAYCFAKSSRFYSYIMNHPVLGSYIKNYRTGTMSKSHKIKTLALLWLSILGSVVIIGKLIPAIILPLIAFGVSIHIIRLSAPGLAADETNALEKQLEKTTSTAE